jgi:isopenicillin N synthase-like dioxygenase
MVSTVDLRSAGAAGDLVGALERDACALLVGHGLDPDLRAEMVAVTRRFFSLSADQKALVRWPGTGEWKGWQPVYQGRPEITGTRIPDLLERFEAQNLESFAFWPSDPPDFADVWTRYYRACASLATSVVTLLVAELGLPGEHLGAWTERQFANLVANHYLPQVGPPLEGQVRTGAHTDRGGLTLLWADQAPGGLEVRPPGRAEWEAVSIPTDAFVLQVGDMFSRWTNGRIKANMHRVANPPRHLAARASRLALVYFHYPHLDTVIEPCGSRPDGRLLETMVARDHFFHRQEHFKLKPDYAPVS